MPSNTWSHFVVRPAITESSSMNVVDEDSLHAMREGFSHLSYVEWGGVESMSSIIRGLSFSSMLFAISTDQQHAAIA